MPNIFLRCLISTTVDPVVDLVKSGSQNREIQEGSEYQCANGYANKSCQIDANTHVASNLRYRTSPDDLVDLLPQNQSLIEF
jgi:hypothetical protein